MPVEVSIVIINYNTFDLTSSCIESVYRQSKGFTFEIILVDNASIECDADLFLEKFPKVKLVKSQANVGFSKGNNLGIKFSKGDNILLLNSDTELNNNAIFFCLEKLKKDKKIGVITTKLTYPDGTIQFSCQRFPNLYYNLLEFLRVQKIFPVWGGKTLLSCFFDYRSIIEVDWTWGAFFMFSKIALEELPEKKLNDDFFMYCEDMLWCYEFKNLGYKTVFIPDGEVVHHVGASGGPKSQQMIENHQVFLNRYYSSFKIRMINWVEKLL